MIIVPTILAYDKRDFKARWKRIVPLSSEIQIDLMDGRFVPTKSIELEEMPRVGRYKKKAFEAHLMVKEPMPAAAELHERGYRRFIIHYETIQDVDVPLIRHFLDTKHSEFVLAINPETPITSILPHADLLDGVCFLGVHPGHNHAPYLEETPRKVAAFVRKNPKPSLVVQVDGGMTPETIRGVARAGATRINTGSYVGNAKNPARALAALYAAAGERS